MKPTDPADGDKPLSRLLSEWRVDAPVPPRFQEQVWTRIDRLEAKDPRSVWAGLISLLNMAFARPRVAYSYLSILILLGMAGGTWAAQREATRLDAQLGSRYVQSIDPYQKMASHP
jgi:hypothetical protein